MSVQRHNRQHLLLYYCVGPVARHRHRTKHNTKTMSSIPFDRSQYFYGVCLTQPNDSRATTTIAFAELSLWMTNIRIILFSFGWNISSESIDKFLKVPRDKLMCIPHNKIGSCAKASEGNSSGRHHYRHRHWCYYHHWDYNRDAYNKAACVGCQAAARAILSDADFILLGNL